MLATQQAAAAGRSLRCNVVCMASTPRQKATKRHVRARPIKVRAAVTAGLVASSVLSLTVALSVGIIRFIGIYCREQHQEVVARACLGHYLSLLLLPTGSSQSSHTL